MIQQRSFPMVLKRFSSIPWQGLTCVTCHPPPSTPWMTLYRRSPATTDMYFMMNKGSETDVVAVSCVASYMAVGARGREQLMHEGLAELLVTKALAQGASGKVWGVK